MPNFEPMVNPHKTDFLMRAPVIVAILWDDTIAAVTSDSLTIFFFSKTVLSAQRLA